MFAQQAKASAYQDYQGDIRVSEGMDHQGDTRAAGEGRAEGLAQHNGQTHIIFIQGVTRCTSSSVTVMNFTLGTVRVSSYQTDGVLSSNQEHLNGNKLTFHLKSQSLPSSSQDDCGEPTDGLGFQPLSMYGFRG